MRAVCRINPRLASAQLKQCNGGTGAGDRATLTSPQFPERKLFHDVPQHHRCAFDDGLYGLLYL